jgi:hypothetical protein
LRPLSAQADRIGQQVPVDLLNLEHARPGHAGDLKGGDPGAIHSLMKVCRRA